MDSLGVDSGTTIIAVTFDGGVVLGADSRTSTGACARPLPRARGAAPPPPAHQLAARFTRPLTPSPPPPPPAPAPAGSYVANRVSDKLTPLHDRIYCCRSGSASDTQALSDYARRALSDHALVKGGAPTVAAAAHVFRKMCYDNKDRLLAGIIVAGWDPVQGGQVYEIPLGGTCVRGNVALGGSGSTYIHGFVDSAFRPGAFLGGADNFAPRGRLSLAHPLPLTAPARAPLPLPAGMTRDECLKFVRQALAHAMARDGSSGGVIRTVVIDKDGCTRAFVAGDQLPFMLTA